MAESIEPALLKPLALRAPPGAGPLQRVMEALNLALRLRMPDRGKMAANPLFHQPHQKLCPATWGCRIPPGLAVIHQHLLGQAAADKDPFQPLPHCFCAGSAGLFQCRRIAAVVVQHRERADGCLVLLLPLEVHLPKLVRARPFKPLRGWSPTIGSKHQAMAQKHPMYRDHRQ